MRWARSAALIWSRLIGRPAFSVNETFQAGFRLRMRPHTRQQLKRSGAFGTSPRGPGSRYGPPRLSAEHPDAGLRYACRVNPLDAVAAAYAVWVTPDLPLYGLDHERADFAP